MNNPRLGILLILLAVLCFSLMDGMSKYLGQRNDIMSVVMIRTWFFGLFVLAWGWFRSGGIKAVAATELLGLQILRGALLALQVCVIVTAFVRLVWHKRMRFLRVIRYWWCCCPSCFWASAWVGGGWGDFCGLPWRVDNRATGNASVSTRSPDCRISDVRFCQLQRADALCRAGGFCGYEFFLDRRKRGGGDDLVSPIFLVIHPP